MHIGNIIDGLIAIKHLTNLEYVLNVDGINSIKDIERWRNEKMTLIDYTGTKIHYSNKNLKWKHLFVEIKEPVAL